MNFCLVCTYLVYSGSPRGEMAPSSKPQAEIQLYIDGKGPLHIFKTDLKGWQPNRIDLDSIMKTYSLQKLYAYSAISGRGLELIPDRRNGLSLTTYMGREDLVVRLDGKPNTPVIATAAFTSISVLFVALIATAFISSSRERSQQFRNIWIEGPPWPVLLSATLIFAVFALRSFKGALKRWYR